MANLNRIILVGAVATDPETRTTMDSTPITKFQIAVERFGSAGAGKETDFIDVVAWRNVADYCSKALSKGMLAVVEGRIQNRSFETKDGVKKYVTEVVANNVTVLDKKKGKPSAAAEEPVTDPDLVDDDLPF